MKKQKTSKHQNITKFEKESFSLVRLRMLRFKKEKLRRGILCTTLDAFYLPDFGGTLNLMNVLLCSLDILHLCSEFWLDKN